MKKLRWGLIGCGDIARKRIAPALVDLPTCELVAVSRANFDKAESFAREFGAKRWYRDWQELVADEEVDAVYIATPVYLHAAQTVATAEAGKHVLCEKPMAMSTLECDKMIEACEANRVKLGIAYYRNHYLVIDRIKEILSKGELGQAVIAQVNAFESFQPESAHPRRWLIERDLSGGGPMMDFGCHRIEVLINLFGHVKEIKSLVGNILFDREVEDTATALLQFEDGPQGTLTVTHAAFEQQDTLDIFCSSGSIHVASLNKGEMRVKTSTGERIEDHPPHANLHQPLIADFVEAVLNDRAPKVDGQRGREVARINEEIYRNDERGMMNDE